MSALVAALAVGHGAALQAVGALGTGALVAGAEPSPSPSPSVLEIPPEDQTSPGFLGFLVTFGVAVVVILLAFSLVRHLRVVERNARRREAEQDAAEGGSTATGSTATVAPVVHPAATGDPAAAIAAAESGAPAAEEPGVLGPDDPGVLEPADTDRLAPGAPVVPAADDPGVPLDDPGVPLDDPGVPLDDPGVPLDDPGVPPADPAAAPRDPQDGSSTDPAGPTGPADRTADGER